MSIYSNCCTPRRTQTTKAFPVFPSQQQHIHIPVSHSGTRVKAVGYKKTKFSLHTFGIQQAVEKKKKALYFISCKNL